MKQQADRNKTEREFEVGEWVFVKLHPNKQLSLKQKGNTNWCQSFMDHIRLTKRSAK